jgi:hypothetical protein
MTWSVWLAGDSTDLEMLADALDEPELRVLRCGEGFVLQSSRFEVMTDASMVREEAERIAESLTGAASLHLDSPRPITVGGAFREDGPRKDIYVFVENAAAATARALPPTIALSSPSGPTQVQRPADPIVPLVKKALSDPNVAKVLRLRDSANLSWVELYRVFEVVEGSIAPASIDSRGWATKSELRLFKHTANSVAAAGDEARHGSEATQPPKDPMSIDEARALIDRIIRSWLSK